MAHFYGCGYTFSRLEPLRGGSLLFTTKFSKIHGTYFINLENMTCFVSCFKIRPFALLPT